MKGLEAILVGVLLAVCQAAPGATASSPAAGDGEAPAAVAGRHLAAAEAAWGEAQYDRCREEVKAGLAAVQPGFLDPPSLTRTLSRLHVLEALLAYTYRDEGYAQDVDAALLAAIQIEPYVELGDPALVPAFVTGRFTKIRDAYLGRFAPSARPNRVGGFAALVLEPTVITNPAVLQPGLLYGRSIGGLAGLEADFRFPLQWPPWSSIRGQLGLVVYPAFAIERVATGVSLSYVFGLDNLSTYTHSISFGGRAEWISRSGFGVAANAELARIDLVVGSTVVTEPPRYTEIPLLGVVNVVFANVTLSVFYVF